MFIPLYTDNNENIILQYYYKIINLHVKYVFVGEAFNIKKIFLNLPKFNNIKILQKLISLSPHFLVV